MEGNKLTRLTLIEKMFCQKKIKCIDNPLDFPFIEIGGIYKAIEQHPVRKDYFAVLAKGGVIAYYKKIWFETVI